MIGLLLMLVGAVLALPQLFVTAPAQGPFLAGLALMFFGLLVVCEYFERAK